MKNNKHVVPNPGGGWDVKSGGQRISHHSTQQDAIATAINHAKLDRSEVVTHGRNGKIRNKDSYGNDGCPPHG